MDCLANITQSCGGPSIGSHLLLQLFNTLLTAHCSLKTEFPRSRHNDHLNSYDFIIVGAGSSGSAVAGTLAKRNPQWRILLLEAGGEPNHNIEIPLLFFNAQKTKHDWQYLTEPQKNACLGNQNNQCAWPRGKVLGGCSAINAMLYHMGNPIDYDFWKDLGNNGWGWDDVKMYFERHLSGESEIKPEAYDLKDDIGLISETRKAIKEAMMELGHPIIEDSLKKAQGFVGTFDSLGTLANGQRLTSARAFLSPLTKNENIHIITNAHVIKVVIDPVSKIATGIEVVIHGKTHTIHATKEVVLSGGTVNSPQLLMLSGIGPKENLQEFGIKVISDIPVGQNLYDHSSTIIPLILHQSKSDAELDVLSEDDFYKYLTKRQGPFGTTLLANIATYISPLNATNPIAEVSFHYIYYPRKRQEFVISFMKGWNIENDLGDQIIAANEHYSVLMMFMVLLRPKSKGFIKLKSSDPFIHPSIDPQYFIVNEDLEPLLGGYKFIEKLIKTENMREHELKLLELSIDGCSQFPKDSDESRLCLIKHMTSTLYHPVGTCKMGSNAKDSVVDEKLKVFGVNRLRVVDGSIMPTIVGGNTNAPCIMIGEKAADMIEAEWMTKDKHEEL